MPETTPPPAQPAQPGANKVLEAQKLMNALAARVYDSQKKMGVWGMTPDESPFDDDLSGFFAELHSKISAVYDGWSQTGPTFIADPDPQNGAPGLLCEVSMLCLGLCRRFGVDIGKIFLDEVVMQARTAAEMEKAQKAALAEEAASGNIEAEVVQAVQEIQEGLDEGLDDGIDVPEGTP
jgi:hypothetical protein